jgi:hypothetical protein
MANGFTCPYSGAEQRVVFDPDLSHAGWRVEGGFDPALPFLDRDSGFAAYRMRGGVPNAVKLPQCPYTGKPITIVKRGNLWFGEGAYYKPMQTQLYKEDVQYALNMRMGRAPKGATKPNHASVVVSETSEQRSNPTLGLGGNSEETKKVVDKTIGEIVHAKK